jgi:hypothetical protein
MCVCTPVRRLEGITYWVIEDPEWIYDFINKEVRKEWEEDAQSEGREPQEDPWLKTLSGRKWISEVIEIERVKLNPKIMNYVDSKRSYSFPESLAKRSNELKECIKRYAAVIWPVIVRNEDYMLVDGYCRYTALRIINVQKIYAYIGTLPTR